MSTNWRHKQWLSRFKLGRSLQIIFFKFFRYAKHFWPFFSYFTGKYKRIKNGKVGKWVKSFSSLKVTWVDNRIFKRLSSPRPRFLKISIKLKSARRALQDVYFFLERISYKSVILISRMRFFNNIRNKFLEIRTCDISI